MFSLARSRYALPTYLAFIGVNGIGVLFSVIYNTSTPDLYEDNAHHKIGWVATWITVAQVVMGVLLQFSRRSGKPLDSREERAAFLPMSVEAMAAHQREQAQNLQAMNSYQWHRDSGQGTERASSSLNSYCASPTEEHQATEFERFIKCEANSEAADGASHSPSRARTLFRITALEGYLKNRIPGLFSHRVLAVLDIAHNVTDRLILILGFIAISTGAVTYGGIMVSNYSNTLGRQVH